MALKSQKGRRLDRYHAMHATALDIISSPKVRQFCIGITGSKKRRKGAYAQWCKKYGGNLKGFVILDWEHSPDEILRMEEWLFNKLKPHPKYANQQKVKYYRHVNRKLKKQDIYIAWWSPAFWN